MLASKRPLLIALFNRINYRVKLDAESLMKEASKATGLTNFGEGNLKEALSHLINSINREASLHAFGLFISKQRISNVLKNRLYVEELCRKHPEIEELAIEKPIIITGLQRTGTTRLQRLLAAHPDVRSLSSWEALNPAPLPKDSNNKKRKNFAQTAERALRYMSPDFFAIHPVEYEAPEEDVLLNDMTFVSAVSEATMNIPSYSAWLENQSTLFSYQYLKKILQVLQWQNPNKKWVLKTPEHLGNLEEIFAVFPDAKLIHCYRDPLKVIPSFSSMLYHSNRIFSDKVDAEKLARHWLQKNAKMVDGAFNYWEEHPNSPVLHISYYDMMRKTKEEMNKISSYAGLAWNEEIEAIIEQKNNKNQQHKYGVHQYKLADFNLSKEEVDASFRLYREKLNIPYE
ncbi:MAG: sulfotransferase [Bacteroidetes bacterium]|nr:sulfotransferase [Bacteroidota bacterium]